MLIVTSATILRRHERADHVTLFTTLPCPGPFVELGDERLGVDFVVPRGYANAYLAAHFPNVPVTLIEPDARSQYKFSRD
jgi:hypothetical protein